MHPRIPECMCSDSVHTWIRSHNLVCPCVSFFSFMDERRLLINLCVLLCSWLHIATSLSVLLCSYVPVVEANVRKCQLRGVCSCNAVDVASISMTLHRYPWCFVSFCLLEQYVSHQTRALDFFPPTFIIYLSLHRRMRLYRTRLAAEKFVMTRVSQVALGLEYMRHIFVFP